MESNEVKRFKAMIRDITHNFEKVIILSFIITFIVNGFLTGFIFNITQSVDKAKLYFAICFLTVIGGLFFLLNEYDAEENQEEKETGC